MDITTIAVAVLSRSAHSDAKRAIRRSALQLLVPDQCQFRTRTQLGESEPLLEGPLSQFIPIPLNLCPNHSDLAERRL
jgi:hypothetical protein